MTPDAALANVCSHFCLDSGARGHDDACLALFAMHRRIEVAEAKLAALVVSIEELMDGLCECGDESCSESAWLIALRSVLGGCEPDHDCLKNADHNPERGSFCTICDRFILLAEFK